MKTRPPLPLTLLVTVALCLLLAAPVCAGTTEGQWMRVESKNFELVGNASERDMRKVAARLELFRQAFVRLLPVERLDSSIPMTVMVFKSDESYRPFEPLYRGQPADVSGFFQSNPDVDYITLSVDQKHVRDADSLAFHEYVHLLVRNSFLNAPLWFNEGLAEYYSTFEVSNGNRRVTLGKPISYRLKTLREHELLPLDSLFKVESSSAYYNEGEKRRLYYAEAWALVHYLLSGPRRIQLSTYLSLLAKGSPVDDAFQQSFQTSFAQIEGELRQYIRLERFPEQLIAFDKGLELDTTMESSVLTEAESQFYLGDLLLHINRIDESEPYLQRAVALDPNLARGHASLGMLRMRQNQFDDAEKHLQRAATGSSNYLAHYYYAYVLSEEGTGANSSQEGFYGPEKVRLMRSELRKSIELAPTFVEAYRLLAFINLVQDEELAESIALLKKAIELSPGRPQLSLLLAQIYLRREDFNEARTILEAARRDSLSPQIREQVRDLLERVAAREALVARVQAMNADAFKAVVPAGIIQPCDAPQPGPQLKKLRFEGRQICGLLVRVECDETGVVLFVDADGKTLKLHSEQLNRIRFVSYTADVRGQVTCGLRTPANPVLVTYREHAVPNQINGEVIAVEFVPREWNTNH
ncbi:MAG: hypothetical protein QOJ64_3849 [Acidobacteriota bacterium]|nr:hypothetical protein [Acidobacteriota bacterium]